MSSDSHTTSSRSSHAFRPCMQEKILQQCRFSVLLLSVADIEGCQIVAESLHVYPKKDKRAHGKNVSLPRNPPHSPFAALNVMFPHTKTHQMERQRQHQEKYPQIEVAGVVEFVLVRVVVPASGQRCPDSLTQGLHNL